MNNNIMEYHGITAVNGGVPSRFMNLIKEEGGFHFEKQWNTFTLVPNHTENCIVFLVNLHEMKRKMLLMYSFRQQWLDLAQGSTPLSVIIGEAIEQLLIQESKDNS
jgi:hypothetical protein